jgi:hypothetical protein
MATEWLVLKEAARGHKVATTSAAFYQANWVRILGCLKRVRFLHVMHNDKFSQPYIELVNEHFEHEGHVFVFYGGCSEAEFSIPDLANVVVLRGPKQLHFLGLFIRAAQRIFFHSFLVHPTLAYLHRFRRRLHKAAWIIWGADLYGDKAVRETDYFRNKQAVVQSLGGLIVVAPGDLDIAREYYGFSGPGYYGLYRLPVSRKILDGCGRATGNGEIVVQINNSCDASVLDTLQELRRFSDRPMKIRTILSYGDKCVQDKIMRTGREYFGQKFVAVTEFLPPERYGELVAEARILIMNQPRQQGLGNIYAFLYCGAKVFIRSDVTSWTFLRARGFEIFDTLRLRQESFETFVAMDERCRLANKTAAGELLDDNYIAKLWGELFSGSAPVVASEAPLGV